MELRGRTFRNPNTRTGRSAAKVVGALASLALVASGCGGGSGSASSQAESTSPKPLHKSGDHPTLTFDALGGGSSVIEVFPTPRSHNQDGTFYGGDTAPAICKTDGREVHSDPSAGEANRHSDQWVKIHGSPGLQQYATAVYIEGPAKLLGELPKC